MAAPPDKPGDKPADKPARPARPADDREARRAAALRENLRRRKAQARARQETDKPAPKDG